jgi:hypothetical protein
VRKALDAVRSKTARICSLICDHGYKADGERCVKITCKADSFLNRDNTCTNIHHKSEAVRDGVHVKHVLSTSDDDIHGRPKLQSAPKSERSLAARYHAVRGCEN